MKLLKSRSITFLYLVPMLTMSIFSWTFIYQQNYKQSAAGPGGFGVFVNEIFFDTIAYGGLIATSIFLLALFLASLRGFRHDILGVLAVLSLTTAGWAFNKIFFGRIRLGSAPGVADIYPGTILPSLLLGLLIVAIRKWGLIRTRNWQPGLDIQKANSTFSILQAIVSLSMSLVTLAVWWWVMQNWVEPGFSEAGKQLHVGFTTEKAMSAGIVAKGILAGGILWLMQLVPMADRTRVFLLGSKGVLVLLMLWALSLGAPPEVGFLVGALVAFWLVGSLYLLGPLAGVEVRFLPFQARYARRHNVTEPLPA